MSGKKPEFQYNYELIVMLGMCAVFWIIVARLIIAAVSN